MTAPRWAPCKDPGSAGSVIGPIFFADLDAEFGENGFDALDHGQAFPGTGRTNELDHIGVTVGIILGIKPPAEIECFKPIVRLVTVVQTK